MPIRFASTNGNNAWTVTAAKPDCLGDTRDTSFTLVVCGVRADDNTFNRWFFEVPGICQMRTVSTLRLEGKLIANDGSTAATPQIAGNRIVQGDWYYIFLTYDHSGALANVHVASATTGGTLESGTPVSTAATTGWAALSGTEWGIGKPTGSVGSDRADFGLFGGFVGIRSLLTVEQMQAIVDERRTDFWTPFAGASDAGISFILGTTPKDLGTFGTIAAGTFTPRAFIRGVTATQLTQLSAGAGVVAGTTVTEVDPYQTNASGTGYDARALALFTARGVAADLPDPIVTSRAGIAPRVKRMIARTLTEPTFVAVLSNSRGVRVNEGVLPYGVPSTYLAGGHENFAWGYTAAFLAADGDAGVAGSGMFFLPTSANTWGDSSYRGGASPVVTGTVGRSGTKGVSRSGTGSNSTTDAAGDVLYEAASGVFEWRRNVTDWTTPTARVVLRTYPGGPTVRLTPTGHTASSGAATDTGTTQDISLDVEDGIDVDAATDFIAYTNTTTGNGLQLNKTAATQSITAGMHCYFEGSTGDLDEAEVESVVVAEGVTITFRHDLLPTQPGNGTGEPFDSVNCTTFKFGTPVYKRIDVPLTGLTGAWRAVRVTHLADVTTRSHVHFYSAFDAARNAPIFVPAGWSGNGYGSQIDEGFTDALADLFEAAGVKIVLVHPATQDDAGNVDALLDMLAAMTPRPDVVLVGPETHNPTANGVSGSTGYGDFHTEHLAQAVARNLPFADPNSATGSLGSQIVGAERADYAHISPLGNMRIAQRVIGLLETAATSGSMPGGFMSQMNLLNSMNQLN